MKIFRVFLISSFVATACLVDGQDTLGNQWHLLPVIDLDFGIGK